jgi:general secretion pathway protein A
MYLSFFGLQQEPFSIAPDPRFLYLSDKHRDALALLNYGLNRGASFVLLTGEIGAGKTTVWRRFLEELPSNFDVANVVNPKLDAQALIARICEDLRLETPRDEAPIDMIDALHGHLLLAHAMGRRTLIVIDEAQALSNEVLEQLRLLTNLDSSGRKLQVMLIGQPELRQTLRLPQLEPLAQRVVARYHLPALSESETAGYIAHRLAVAGLRGPAPFDGESIGLIHRLCAGVPRRINVVCDQALANAQAAGRQRVDRHAVERAVAATYGGNAATVAEPKVERAAVNVWAAAGVAAAALVGGVLLAPRVQSMRGADDVARPPVAQAAPATNAVGVEPGAGAVAEAAPARSTLALATAAATKAAPPSDLQALAKAPARLSLTGPAQDALFTAAAADESAAWRTLAGLWGARLGPGDACAAALAQSLRCLRLRGGVATILQLDRPGLLRLVDERGRVAHALLTGIGGELATLNVAGTDATVSWTELARVWRGDFATLWRAPAGYGDGEVAGNTAWLAERLAAIDGQGPIAKGREALRARIAAFQLAHGLTPDGLAGPLTVMQLARAGQDDEPRLTR